MVIKLYISGISGNKEVKKKQQRVQMILDSKQINYEAIDITEPGKEKDKEFMQQNGKVRESLGKHPLPPQIFNDDDFCGDYEDFDMANEVDELEKFLHIETSSKDVENGSKRDEKSNVTGGFFGKSNDPTNTLYNPYEYHEFAVKYDSVNGLKEKIININNLNEEKNQIEEISKSEVNGESETFPILKPSNDSISENVELTAADVLAPEKEESAPVQTTAEDESEDLGPEEKAEREEKEEEIEVVENPKVEGRENPEKSPLTEGVDKEKEEQEEESDQESPESEKLQEE